MIKAERGFTIIEVLIVVAIVGVLAVLVIPRYFGQNERGYVAEAVGMLSAIRQAEVGWNLEYSVYAPVASLDVDLTQTKFSYGVVTATGTATATRTGGTATFSGKTITLNIGGTWGGDHPFKPS